LRVAAPLCVLLEIDAKPNSRARFGEILRHRLSDTRLVAVGPQPPTGSFAFDDYLEAPITASSLISLIGRAQMGNNSHVMQHGPIRLDLVTRTVVTPKGRHRMTPKQCALLQMLLDNHDQVVSRRDIMQTIWETSFMEDTRTLDVHIRWLRERIEPDPSDPIYLRTVRGQGYHLSLKG
jgi:DNA-binding response OmpR family regulator